MPGRKFLARQRSKTSRNGHRHKGRNRFNSRNRNRSRSRSHKRARSRQGRNEQGRTVRTDTFNFPHPANLASLSFIHPNLYLTCLEGAMRHKGDDIAIVAAGTRNVTDYMKDHDCAYRAFVIADDTPHMDEDDFNSIFGVGADLLNKALNLNKTTLLHCRAGINRSVAVALAYVKRYTDLDVNEMLKKIRRINAKKRSMPALINRTFAKHLGSFE